MFMKNNSAIKSYHNIMKDKHLTDTDYVLAKVKIFCICNTLNHFLNKTKFNLKLGFTLEVSSFIVFSIK